MSQLQSPSRLSDLIALAREPSSAKRRELLRDITDLFFASAATSSARDIALFDDVLLSLAREMEVEVRTDLADRMAQSQHAPAGLVNYFSRDEISVAAPILAQSPVLTPEDLLAIVASEGQDHLRAVCQRKDLSENLSGLIIERGDDQTLDALLRNPIAPLSRTSAETVIDRATRNPDLHQAVVLRRNLPVDLLNEMYFVVEARIRQLILARNAELSPEDVTAALETARKRVAARDGALPADLASAEVYVRDLKARGSISPAILVSMLRHGERTRFVVALADLTDIDFNTARSIVERGQLDALAVICRAADFGLPMFLTFVVLILDNGAGMEAAQAYGPLYSELPRDVAQRTLRFWKVRRDSGDV